MSEEPESAYVALVSLEPIDEFRVCMAAFSVMHAGMSIDQLRGDVLKILSGKLSPADMSGAARYLRASDVEIQVYERAAQKLTEMRK